VTPFLVAVAAIGGLMAGSFAANAAYGIPRREGVLSGGSRCSRCDSATGPLENIPLVGFVVQRARCRRCGGSLLLRYPLLELASSVLFVLSALRFHWRLETVVYAAFFWVLLVLTVIDLDHRLLPDRVVYPSLVAGGAGLIVAAVVGGYPEALVHAAIGSVIFGGFLFIVAFIHPAGMGGGDVKLSFLLGMFLGYLDGWGVVVVAMFLSFVLGGVIGVIVMVVTGGGRKTQVPFGPFLVLGTVLGTFLGHALLRAYLGAG
jgi:leader peptidase (prepilin peptidase) / N-methyltransferase